MNRKTRISIPSVGILTRDELLTIIFQDEAMCAVYNSWKPHHQWHFLDICTGYSCVSMLEPMIWKLLILEGNVVDAIRQLLVHVIGEPIKILEFMFENMDNSKDGDLITDVRILRIDGREELVQILHLDRLKKEDEQDVMRRELLQMDVGNRLFPEKKKEENWYRYRIVFVDHSPEEFYDYTNIYIHRGCKREQNTLFGGRVQETCFVCLDLYLHNRKRNGVHSFMDKWCEFLTIAKPGLMNHFIEKNDSFACFYRSWFSCCKNLELVINTYSQIISFY